MEGTPVGVGMGKIAAILAFSCLLLPAGVASVLAQALSEPEALARAGGLRTKSCVSSQNVPTEHQLWLRPDSRRAWRQGLHRYSSSCRVRTGSSLIAQLHASSGLPGFALRQNSGAPAGGGERSRRSSGSRGRPTPGTSPPARAYRTGRSATTRFLGVEHRYCPRLGYARSRGRPRASGRRYWFEAYELRTPPGASGGAGVTERGVIGIVLQDATDSSWLLPVERIIELFTAWDLPVNLLISPQAVSSTEVGTPSGPGALASPLVASSPSVASAPLQAVGQCGARTSRKQTSGSRDGVQPSAWCSSRRASIRRPARRRRSARSPITNLRGPDQDQEDFSVTPLLAEKWTFSPDLKTLTFKLTSRRQFPGRRALHLEGREVLLRARRGEGLDQQGQGVLRLDRVDRHARPDDGVAQLQGAELPGALSPRPQHRGDHRREERGDQGDQPGRHRPLQVRDLEQGRLGHAGQVGRLSRRRRRSRSSMRRSASSPIRPRRSRRCSPATSTPSRASPAFRRSASSRAIRASRC